MHPAATIDAHRPERVINFLIRTRLTYGNGMRNRPILELMCALLVGQVEIDEHQYIF